jgi:hypothetical protein
MVELLKAITSSSNGTPLYLNPIPVMELVSTTVQRGDAALWLSAASVLPYRVASREKAPESLNRFVAALHTTCQSVLSLCSNLDCKFTSLHDCS